MITASISCSLESMTEDLAESILVAFWFIDRSRRVVDGMDAKPMVPIAWPPLARFCMSEGRFLTLLCESYSCRFKSEFRSLSSEFMGVFLRLEPIVLFFSLSCLLLVCKLFICFEPTMIYLLRCRLRRACSILSIVLACFLLN